MRYSTRRQRWLVTIDGVNTTKMLWIWKLLRNTAIRNKPTGYKVWQKWWSTDDPMEVIRERLLSKRSLLLVRWCMVGIVPRWTIKSSKKWMSSVAVCRLNCRWKFKLNYHYICLGWRALSHAGVSNEMISFSKFIRHVRAQRAGGSFCQIASGGNN